MSIIAREPIRVIAAFEQGRAKPLQFQVGTRTYRVRAIDLTFSTKHGRDKLHYFSVYDGTNTFRLAYSSETLEWHLETEEVMV